MKIKILNEILKGCDSRRCGLAEGQYCEKHKTNRTFTLEFLQREARKQNKILYKETIKLTQKIIIDNPTEFLFTPNWIDKFFGIEKK